MSGVDEADHTDVVDAVAADEAVTALAPSEEAVAAAQAELVPLLEAAGLELVVFVDNEFEVSLDDLLIALSEIPPDRRAHVPFLGDGINFDVPEEDEEVWMDAVSERYESLSPWERAVAGADATARTGEIDLRDQPNAGALGLLIPAEMTELLSPAAWDERKAEILAAAPERGTLVLLDRHFEDGDDAGPRMLVDIFKDENASHLRAGIVTNTVTREEEQRLWRELVERFELPPDRLVVISKQNLAEGCLSFPQALKVALLTPQFDDLLRVVAEAIASAHDSAIETLRAISPYEFERLVFAFSHREGVWEPETLLRLVSISTRQDALNVLRGDASIHTRVRETRRIASSPTTETSATTDMAATKARALQHAEVFEDGSYINGVHLPLDLGDVFRKREGETAFILVAQPCDLMVRAGGKRTPEPEFLTLVKLATERPTGDPSTYHELEFFHADGTSGFALLNRESLVPAEAVDLCVYNESGSVEIPIAGDAPHRVTPHWDSRFLRHQGWAKSSVEKVLSVPDDDVRSMVSRAAFRCSDAGIASVKITDNNSRVEFNFVRIGRLRPPASISLLGAYLSFKGRMAFEGRLYRED